MSSQSAGDQWKEERNLPLNEKGLEKAAEELSDDEPDAVAGGDVS